MRKTFSYRDENSDKFWTVDVEGKTLTVIFGKTGTAGRTNIKEFESNADAQKEVDKLIKEKTRKGYIEIFGGEQNNTDFGILEFWNLIERSKRKATGDVNEQVEILTEILTERPVADIIEFGRILNYYHALSYTSELWAAAYIIQGGCSDDAFDYFRAWIIAQGREVFDNALENPESLAKLINVEEAEETDAESLLYVSQEAYKSKTGGDIDEFSDREGFAKFPEIEFDWKEDDGSLERKFPKLYVKFT
jgi:predicted DNA-binding WGR domain protein